MVTIYNLPNELLSIILDFLVGDWVSLLACTVVCKWWAVHALRRSFKVIRVCGQDLKAFCNVPVTHDYLAENLRQLTLENVD